MNQITYLIGHGKMQSNAEFHLRASYNALLKRNASERSLAMSTPARAVFLLIVVSLAFGMIGAAPLRLAKLKLINKSDMPIEISLTGKEEEKFYYLHLAEGSRLAPTEQVYTVVRDQYTSSIYYVELWDPVYGHQCSTKGQTLDITRDVQIVILACDRTPPNGGEKPSQIKYGGQNSRRR